MSSPNSWSRCFDSLELELRAVSEVGKKQIVEGEEARVSIRVF